MERIFEVLKVISFKMYIKRPVSRPEVEVIVKKLIDGNTLYKDEV